MIKRLKKNLLSSLFLAVFSSSASLVASGDIPVFATQISAQNAHALISKGPDAIGGIDDWFFTNGVLCGIISDIDHEGQLSTKGGSLIDLGFCGRADDHFTETRELLQASQRRPIDTVKIRLEQDQNSASIIVHGKQSGAKIITRYTLSLSNPQQVHITKKLTRDEGEKFNFFVSINFNYHSLEPFVFNSKEPHLNNGFQAEDFVSRGVSAMSVAARNADTIITISPPSAELGIAYGWQLKSAHRVNSDERYAVPHFVLADGSSNAMIILTDTFYIGDGRKMGWLQLAQIPLTSLDKSSSIETHEVIYVGKKGDVASITDQLFETAPVISGQLSETNVAVHISDFDGVPFSHVRPDENGRFSFRAPKGKYTLTVNGTAGRQTVRTINHSEPLNLGTIELPKAAKILLPQGHAMRLRFVGINGTEDPDFADRLTGFSVKNDEDTHYIPPVSNLFLAGVESDIKTIDIAPGDYQVFATKGPEYSLEKAIITVRPDDTLTLKIEIPKPAVHSPNFIASDLHVHSGISFDNAFSETERVRTFVAEHGEVMVSSEHDVPVDFSPRIKALGVSDKIISIAAAEVTGLLPTEQNHFTGGHANFFPYKPTPHAYRRGMVNHEDKRWRDIIHDIKQQQGDQILVQLNHARLNTALSGDLPNNWEELVDNGHFLDHMGSANHPYNPSKSLHSHPNNSLIEPHQHTGVRDLDIDLMEIINPEGNREHNRERIKALRLDWLSFIRQGEKIVATANSDSHHSRQQVAVPRTMVAVSDDRVSNFKQSEFFAALKSGNAYGTTGPLINVSLSGAKMGETFTGQRGQLSINIRSADWIPVTSARIQINGETVDEYTLNTATQHDLLIPLSFEKDSFVTIEVSGPAPLDYQKVYPGLEPYAFSNPIYVDFDNDGEWLAPGL